MASSHIEPERIRRLDDDEPRSDGDYVLYWMEQSQRAEHNPALELAIQRANEHDRPLLVAVGVADDAALGARHLAFGLQGLAETREALADRNVSFVVRRGDPADVAIELAERATQVVCDMGVLRHQRAWRDRVAKETDCRVERVEGDVIVPVEVASDKREYAARTLRPKLHEHAERFVRELATTSIGIRRDDLGGAGLDLSDPIALLEQFDVDTSVAPTDRFRGGTRGARSRFVHFVRDGLSSYDEHRSQPETHVVSAMSMHLHFGQISPVWLALHLGEGPAAAVYLEELLVRRELAWNYCWYERAYDAYDSLPDWARETLAEHRDDARDPEYDRETLEHSGTADRYWNAAMTEMRETGYLHNHMRMYWGKKVLEWSKTPEEGFETLLALNNRYFLDGRDPSSFANVAWVFGLHDRPFQERSIYGKVRSMSAAGLERKGDPEAYVERVEALVNGT